MTGVLKWRCLLLQVVLVSRLVLVAPESAYADTPIVSGSDGLAIINTRAEFAEQLAALQRLNYPTVAPHELIGADQYRLHLEIFPEGQFVAVVPAEGNWRVVAATSTFRITKGPQELGQHTYADITTDNWFGHHDPTGAWLYGADMNVHPDYRGKGIGTILYDVRRALVKRLNLRGEIAGGMLPGYEAYSNQHTLESYVDAVARGELKDPTLTPQLRNGFLVRGILRGYLQDHRSRNSASLIVRTNPDYVEK